MLKELRERLAALLAQRAAITKKAVDEARGLTDDEKTQRSALGEQVEALEERIAELEAQEKREAVAAEHRVATGTAAGDGVQSEPNPVYRRDHMHDGPSFFRDLFDANLKSDRAARERLISSQETRALSTGATAGGTLAPPLWLVEDFVKYARPGRVTADLIGARPLESGVSSVNLPKIATGTTVGVTQTQNTAISNTDLTTTSVSSGITTISGQQVVSLELIHQSGIPFDEVVLSDLALAYAAQLDVQVLSGSGSNGQLRGLDNGSGVGATTYTTTVPAVVSTVTANSFYNKLISASNNIHTTRYLPAQAIVMHPRRWNWVLEALDGNSRPLVVPEGSGFNNVAVSGANVAEGPAGRIAGLPVYLDPNIATNIGAATNQDVVYVLRQSDCWLYETDVQQASFDATYANQNSILFRVLGFSAFIPDRYGPSVNPINGTGLTAPTL